MRGLKQLQEENTQLKATLADHESRTIPENSDLASLDESYEITLHWKKSSTHGSYKKTEAITVTWAEIFALIAPDLQEHPDDNSVNRKLGSLLYRKLYPDADRGATIQHENFQTIRVQLSALDLINVSYSKTVSGGAALFWGLTKRGQRLMTQLRTVKSASNQPHTAKA